MPHHLIVIAGPTAVGKTAVSLQLAQHYACEIVSADSRQIYKELDIGVAKPTTKELQTVPHHFINHRSIEEDYNAGQYETDALKCLDKLFKKNNKAMLVGGSGLYIKAVCEGFDTMPESNLDKREELNELLESKGLPFLQKKLKKSDPDYYAEVDLQNPQRVIRALEAIETTGKPFSQFRKKQAITRPFNIIKIGLKLDRELIYQRINERVDQMMEAGLLAEAKARYPSRHLNALQTVGYQELFNYFDNKITLEEAASKIKQNTRNYAKRQLTWFRKDKEIKWFEPGQTNEIKKFITNKITDLEAFP